MLSISSKRTSPLKSAATQEIKKLDGEAGLTLIECLVAIAVIASTIGVIAPVTVLAVATRVRNQRAEQAALIAQAEIDRIRVTVERSGASTLNNVASTTTAGVVITNLDSVLPPVDIDNVAASTSATSARGVDINGDNTNDFAVQTFRTNSTAGISSDGDLVAFELGVRVYQARAVEENASNLETDQVSLTLTSGDGQRSTRPLAVLYTTIVKSDNKESLCDYYRYVDPSSTASVIPGSCT